MTRIHSLQNQQGYLTLISVVLIVIVGFIAVALAYISYGSAFATNNIQQATSALYIAESGLEDAAHALLASTLSNRSACSGLSLTNASIGNGTYTVTATGPFYTSSITTLNGALNASATSIPVASTTNYQTAGRIMIDQELINYNAIDATHFLNAQRGVDGSTAASHVTATPVGQYQCLLLSTGGAPALTYSSGAPGGKRILNEAIQLQEGWVVGNTAGGNLSLMRWNKPTERTWNNAAITGTFILNSVSMISYVDGWAVGASVNFLHWNGSSWSSVASGLSNVTYNDVFCLAKNNCHVVGYMVSPNSQLPTIADWNGTAWTATTLNTGSRAGDQYAIHCASLSDCWAVGDIGKSPSSSNFYHWNGTTWSSSSLAIFAVADFPFKGVYCTNISNCWAVGASANFALWNGTSWTRVASGMPSAQYNAIYCNSASDCWAVGNISGSDLIIHWNGTAWSRNASNPTPATNLNAVSCTGTNDCWAVGAAAGGQPSFIHWDGTSWITFTTTGLPNIAASAIDIIGPGSQPWSVWTENFG